MRELGLLFFALDGTLPDYPAKSDLGGNEHDRHNAENQVEQTVDADAHW
jgi:hypothetical protein